MNATDEAQENHKPYVLPAHLQAPSATGPSEIAAQSGAFPLATGSLPVASVASWLDEMLTARIATLEKCVDEAAKDYDFRDGYRLQSSLGECVAIRSRLRAEVARRELRQPEENIGDERRSPERPAAPSVPHTTENPQR